MIEIMGQMPQLAMKYKKNVAQAWNPHIGANLLLVKGGCK